jgi:protein ImuA
MPPLNAALRGRSRAEIAEELRRLLPRLERLAPPSRALSFGLPALDTHLQGGLAYGALHEVAPESDEDAPAAFGFTAALLGRVPGPILLVLSARKFAAYGRPHGHGLSRLGLDPARLILVEAENEKEALWAMEEALHSSAPAAVAGTIGKMDFKTSQRLHLAAGDSRRPLFLLRPAGELGSSVAVTRWRIGAAAAARDRFGLVRGFRWKARLERCRNGRPGQWLLEFDDAYRFSLAAALADPAPARGAILPAQHTA